MPTIDIICPAFREEQSIELFHRRLQGAVAALRARYAVRIVYVVDPSTDRTEAILEGISSREPDVKVLVMSRRFGHQAALVAGIDDSRADAIVMLDSDLQHPPELIPQLVAHWEAGAEVVQMVRQDGPETGLLKRLTSRWFYQVLLKIGNVELPAGAADYRLISKRVSAVFRAQLQERNPFLRGLVTWVGFKTVYVPFAPARRAEGKSNYGASALLSFAINGICSFSKAPLRFAIAVGLIVAVLSLVGGIAQVLVYMLSDTSVPGWPTLIVLITFVAGLQLFFMGVVGEYVGLIFDEVKSRPRYLVDREIEDGKAAARAGDPGRNGAALNEAAPEAVVTRRQTSLFARDLEANRERIASALGGRRMLVVGGGGSIGAATIELLLGYEPAAVHVVDHSENYLAELVRNLRGQDRISAHVDFQALPLDYGGSAMARLLRDAKPYDVVLNFAAVKHVRSEKDVYSVLQMLDTNIVRHIRFKKWLAERGHGGRYFAVSTDKAANPVNLMGASKRLMEDLIFAYGATDPQQVTAARFANVAFSNGSLLAGLAQRVAKRQPVAVPRDTRRYFISHREAGEICVLATTLVPGNHVAIPKLDPASELQSLEAIAVRVLETYGLGAVTFEDESEARAAVGPLAAQGKWPLLLTPLDTSGEKPFEEFVGQDEAAAECGLKTLLAIRHTPSRALDRGLFGRLEQLIGEPGSKTSKAEIVEAIAAALSNFQHRETGHSLDQRL